ARVLAALTEGAAISTCPARPSSPSVRTTSAAFAAGSATVAGAEAPADGVIAGGAALGGGAGGTGVSRPHGARSRASGTRSSFLTTPFPAGGHPTRVSRVRGAPSP